MLFTLGGSMFSFMAMTSPPQSRLLAQGYWWSELGADLRGSGDERLELAAGDLAREVLHAAVGADHEALRVDVLERGADPAGDDFRRLDVHVVQVEDAEDHALRGELLEDRRVEAGLGGL